MRINYSFNEVRHHQCLLLYKREREGRRGCQEVQINNQTKTVTGYKWKKWTTEILLL